MDILHQWYINRQPEAKETDTKTKIELKQLAQDFAYALGKERTASDYQIESVVRATWLCIDKELCSNEEHVINEVVSYLYKMRTDLIIGNEVLFRKIKECLVEIGSLLSTQFDNIKQFFSRSNNKLQKRAIVDWYESPPLMQLVKAIESEFSMLGIDLQQDNSFSDEELVGFLSSLWQTLTA